MNTKVFVCLNLFHGNRQPFHSASLGPGIFFQPSSCAVKVSSFVTYCYSINTFPQAWFPAAGTSPILLSISFP